MSQGTILVVDDEPRIAQLVTSYLERDGFRTLSASTGRSALEILARERPDLLILDLTLPDIDGLDICRQVRASSQIPIVMLTARGEEVDRIIGLEMGADDYVAKPFSPRELVARVRAVLRRWGAAKQESPETEQLSAGGLTIDRGAFEATWRGQKLNLTATEFRLLWALAKTPGRVYSRMQLLDVAQGEAYEGYERTIDVHIKNLRQKMDDAGITSCRVATVRGVGYKLEVTHDEWAPR